MSTSHTMTAEEKLALFTTLSRAGNNAQSPARSAKVVPIKRTLDPELDDLAGALAPSDGVELPLDGGQGHVTDEGVELPLDSGQGHAADEGGDALTSLRKVADAAAEQDARQALAAMTDHYAVIETPSGGLFAIPANPEGRITPIDLAKADAKGSEFLEKLRLDQFLTTGRAPTKQALELAIAYLKHKAPRRKQPIHNRVTLDREDVVIDMGDDDGQRLRVTARGWFVEPGDADILFRRGDGYNVIDAVDTPDDAREAWRWLEPFLERIPQRDRVGVVAWLVAAAIADADYPILLLVGPEGSTKSAIAKSIASVFDPPRGALESINADSSKNLVASVQHRHINVVDNASGRLNKGVEDTLCKISTGARERERQLYSNHDTATAELHAPVIVTAITHPFHQRDTRNRTLAVEIAPLRDGFKRRARVLDVADLALGQVRGAVLFFVSAYLRQRDAIEAEGNSPSRMVEWAIAGEVIGRELGLDAGKFYAQVTQRQAVDAKDYLEGDTAGAALVAVLNAWAAKAEETEDPPAKGALSKDGWAATRDARGRVRIIATAKTLRENLVGHALRGNSHGQPNQGAALPTTERQMAGTLQRLQGVLGRAGIETVPGRITKARFWEFAWQGEVPKSE